MWHRRASVLVHAGWCIIGEMNNDNNIPDLRESTPKSPPTSNRDPSFISPQVNDYSRGYNAPQPDPIRKTSFRDRMGNIKHKIANSPIKGFMSVGQLVLGSILLALFINHFVFQSYQVYGLSMTPTLHEGDRLIISKLEKSLSNISGNDYMPDRGDIIVFKNPRNVDSPQLIKRVIGLPGERVVVLNGDIIIYNKDNPEGFMPDKLQGLESGITVGRVDLVVPGGQIFVSGDNRASGGSLDSRNELGTVPINLIVGELVMRIMPVTDAQVF